MSDLPPPAVQSSPSDPAQDRPVTGEAAPNRIGRALNLVRKLMVYGKELATSLQQGTHTNLAYVMRGFGSADIALIIATIIRGLHRAAELEARLIARLGRKNAEGAFTGASFLRLPRTARPAGPSAESGDSGLVRMPTPKDIAAAVRRRPIGPAIAAICRDLGLTCDHPLWRELSAVIFENNGNVATLLIDTFKRDEIHSCALRALKQAAIAPAAIALSAVPPAAMAPTAIAPATIAAAPLVPDAVNPPATAWPPIAASAQPAIPSAASPEPWPPLPVTSGARPP